LYWAREQRSLLDRLKRDPRDIATSRLELQRGLPWYSRLFNKRPSADEELQRVLHGEVELPLRGTTTRGTSTQQPARKANDPSRDELRALVNDAFDSSAE
jgi:hypothetical protein